jgi:hypothetical protein
MGLKVKNGKLLVRNGKLTVCCCPSGCYCVDVPAEITGIGTLYLDISDVTVGSESGLPCRANGLPDDLEAAWSYGCAWGGTYFSPYGEGYQDGCIAGWTIYLDESTCEWVLTIDLTNCGCSDKGEWIGRIPAKSGGVFVSPRGTYNKTGGTADTAGSVVVT